MTNGHKFEECLRIMLPNNFAVMWKNVFLRVMDYSEGQGFNELVQQYNINPCSPAYHLPILYVLCAWHMYNYWNNVFKSMWGRKEAGHVRHQILIKNEDLSHVIREGSGYQIWWIFRKVPKGGGIPDICHFFTQAKFLENKIYTEIYTVNCQFTQ